MVDPFKVRSHMGRDDALWRFSDKTWDNFVINMLASRYAIEVRIPEAVADRLKRNDVRLFASPNVALEFEFFKSCGRRCCCRRIRSRAQRATTSSGLRWAT